MFQEYPKALYRAGELRTVADADDEAHSRGEGFDDWHADHVRADETPALAAEKEVPAVPAPRRKPAARRAEAA